jgi:hypothetical protein
VGLAAADALVWALTLNAQAGFHAPPGGAVTSLGIVIGWIASITLLIVLVLVLLAARQASAYRRRSAERGRES